MPVKALKRIGFWQIYNRLFEDDNEQVNRLLSDVQFKFIGHEAQALLRLTQKLPTIGGQPIHNKTATKYECLDLDDMTMQVLNLECYLSKMKIVDKQGESKIRKAKAIEKMKQRQLETFEQLWTSGMGTVA